MINCEQSLDNPAFVQGGSHPSKISGTTQYLQKLDETHGNDVVLMSDCYDAWVQLRPQTMVDRNYHINSRSNDRLDLFLGNKRAGQIGIHQDIIFRILERCWSWYANGPPCCDEPKSSLLSDTYSPAINTDANH